MLLWPSWSSAGWRVNAGKLVRRPSSAQPGVEGSWRHDDHPMHRFKPPRRLSPFSPLSSVDGHLCASTKFAAAAPPPSNRSRHPLRLALALLLDPLPSTLNRLCASETAVAIRHDCRDLLAVANPQSPSAAEKAVSVTEKVNSSASLSPHLLQGRLPVKLRVVAGHMKCQIPHKELMGQILHRRTSMEEAGRSTGVRGGRG